MPEKRAVPIMKEILLGFSYAHQKGVVHRDIKPANIIITKSSNCGGSTHSKSNASFKFLIFLKANQRGFRIRISIRSYALYDCRALLLVQARPENVTFKSPCSFCFQQLKIKSFSLGFCLLKK
jgi:serine/threonine protein kinase